MTTAQNSDATRTNALVVALGGNALDFDPDSRHSPALASAATTLASHPREGLILTHGNGPQIGELAMNGSGREALHLLGAKSEGFIGFLIEQALENAHPAPFRCATMLTRVEVDAGDPAFSRPTKPIGPWLDAEEKARLEEHDWQFIRKENQFRRVVPSPSPRRILQADAVRLLVDHGFCVICSGGGGIPVVRDALGGLQGVDAVIDKDHASALLAVTLEADMLILATDVDAVYRDWGEQQSTPIRQATVTEMSRLELPQGSMGPKVEAACSFVRATGRTAVIGALERLEQVLAGQSGTRIQPDRGELHGI